MGPLRRCLLFFYAVAHLRRENEGVDLLLDDSLPASSEKSHNASAGGEVATQRVRADAPEADAPHGETRHQTEFASHKAEKAPLGGHDPSRSETAQQKAEDLPGEVGADLLAPSEAG